jgi:hypothetical protein
MRLQRPAWYVDGLALLLGVALPVQGQSTFQNLGFESASLIPIPADPYGRVQFAPAFIGWTGYVGSVQQSAALYNNEFLDTSGISIIDHGWSAPFGAPGGVIQGNYTALLQAGVGGNSIMSQTGQVPADAQSLQFEAYQDFGPNGRFAVTLGGQTLSLIPVQSGANYTLWGADVHVWAGQAAELDFTVFADQPHVVNEYLYLDAIAFSNSPLPTPEPSIFGLSALGALFLGWRVLGRHRGAA